ncbi:phage minor head protein [Actinoplanes sp. NBRC 101535]|uniref:phage minor head protein n=1 Tax=Actinoplanes sp. NBRC 101535 TaxID=3032196 RepID=UPI0024A4B845|nr:phage minor head protein [Actinoplanes sp. NBRC 101535]GLY08248.1 hypothetical protein Acsp01_86270 [Actinoplanes sp. NBRC 101535]
MDQIAVTERTLWLLDQLTRTTGGHTDDAVRQLTTAWTNAWDTLTGLWRELVDQLISHLAQHGTWPAPWQIHSLPHLAAATAATTQALSSLTLTTIATIMTAAEAVIRATLYAEPGIMASQLPTHLTATAIARYAAMVPPSALEAIVLRVRQQVTSLTWPLTPDATAAMHRALVAGIALGRNPKEAARDMVRRVEGAFNGGLTRAVNIARCEILDAYRETSGQVHAANADVLRGWRWSSALDRRTCVSCWAMHGTVWPLSQPGPWDHHSGRCARLPLTKTWRELGIDLDEPDEDFRSGDQVLAALPAAEQRAILGPARHALYRTGAVALEDMAVLKDNPGWRPSYVPRTVRQLELLAARQEPGRSVGSDVFTSRS